MSILIWKDTWVFNWKNTDDFVWEDDAVEGLMSVTFSQLFPSISFSHLSPTIAFGSYP